MNEPSTSSGEPSGEVSQDFIAESDPAGISSQLSAAAESREFSNDFYLAVESFL